MMAQILPYEPSADWPEPDLGLLAGPQIAAPEFPLAALGPWWSAWATVAAAGANAPVDYVAGGLLTVAAALIGNARVVAASASWSEPPILWAMLVGPPSAGKSPALDPLLRIIADFEADMAQGFDTIQRQHATDSEGAKARRDAWTGAVKAAAKDGREPPLLPADAVEPDPPQRPRIRISDTTMEAAAEIAAGNPKGLILTRDELGGWFRGFNRYGGDGERQFWLEAWGARSYTVDRKKAGRPVVIPRLAVSILGGTQPDVLGDLLRTDQDGFAARFLYVYPEPVRGFRLAVEGANVDAARAALSRLRDLRGVDLGFGENRPFACNLKPAAAAIFEAWWRQHRIGAASEAGHWGAWLGKAGGLVLRLALVLEHLGWCAPGGSEYAPQTISEGTIHAAAGLVEGWAMPMARRAFGVAAMSDGEADAAALGRWLQQNRVRCFNARDLRRASNGPSGLTEAKRMNAACDALEAAGLIRLVPATGGGPGRRPKDYATHPALSGDLK
jgi:hypothetical protein